MESEEFNTSELEEPDFSSEVESCISPLSLTVDNAASPCSYNTSELDVDDSTARFTFSSTSLKSDCSLDDYNQLSLANGFCDSPVGHSTVVETCADLDSSLGCYPISYSSDESRDENDQECASVDVERPFKEIGMLSYRESNAYLKSIAEVRTIECCNEKCILKIEFAQLILARQSFQQLSSKGKKQWILEYLTQHDKQGKASSVLFVVRGYSVCKTAWTLIYGIERKMFHNMITLHRSGKCEIATPYKKRRKTKTFIAKVWMESTFAKIGDKMPDNVRIHLPCYLDFTILYQYMLADLTSVGDEVVCYSQFCKMMKDDFKDVSIPKATRLTKCDICIMLKEEKQKTMDKVARNYYDMLYSQHNQLQREEREKYYHHRQKAKSKPDKITCVIIDGMDQMKLLIPKMLNQAKAYASAWRLKTHLTGVINHGREALGYFDLNQWPHDSNLTLNVLLHVILRMNPIPDKLYLQMDNCWRENKNQFVLTFLGVLVQLDIFKKVKINFLMKGHTHEDCDQLFSRYGTKLSSNNVVTVEDMMTMFEESYSPSPIACLLNQMFDIREWLTPVNAQLHNISNPHVFVIEKNTANIVVLRYKNWSRDLEWKPHNDPANGIPILTPNVDVPITVPNLVPSSPDKVDLQRLERDIPKFLDNSRVITQEQREWWHRWFSNSQKVYGPAPPKPNTWLLNDLKQKKANCIITNDQETRNEEDGNEIPSGVPDDVPKIVAAQCGEIPEVYVGSYRKRTTVTTVDNVWDHVLVESLVAVNLENYNKVPVIGKVLEKKDNEFTIHYWKGSWNKKWEPWLHSERPWTDVLPKECVYLAAFTLNEGDKLSADTKRQMRLFLNGGQNQ